MELFDLWYAETHLMFRFSALMAEIETARATTNGVIRDPFQTNVTRYFKSQGNN